MLENKENVLSGKDNAKLNDKGSMDDVSSEAWADKKTMYDDTKVNIPSSKAVSDAKKWVDNGSKL